MGTTTEMASLLMYAVGAYLAIGPMVVSVVVGGGVTGQGRTVQALPLDRTLEVMRKYGMLSPPKR